MDITFKPLFCTKELILKKVSQEELMEYYVGHSVTKGLFVSPFRTDKKPTVCYYRSKNGDIIYKDFGYPEHTGNFINVVMWKYNCTYAKAMNIIGNDFHILDRPDIEKHEAELAYTGSNLEETQDAIIQVEIHDDFQDYELKWWKSYGITKSTLNKFNVYSCKNIWLNGNLFRLDNKNQHLYGYYGGKYEGIDRWRIYQPGKTKWKFLSNWKSIMIQGAQNLPKSGDFLIIQKSLKDVMLLYEFGIPSIAPNSENTFLSDAIVKKLKNRFKTIVFWFDNDNAGKAALEHMWQKFPELQYFYIPESYEVKDLTDFYKKYGREKTEKFINDLKESSQNSNETAIVKE